MKKLRMLITTVCNRSCSGCCNKQWDLEALPRTKYFGGYDEVIITGGEPMLYPELVQEVAGEIRRQNQHTKIFLYTALVRFTDLSRLIREGYLDGVTVTLHEHSDLTTSFFAFAGAPTYFPGRSFRLNVFKEARVLESMLQALEEAGWNIRRGVEWIENCPLPEDEVFMRYDEEGAHV